MKHWMSMRRMAVGAVSNSTLFLPSSLLSSSKPNPLTIPFSFYLTKTSPFSISVLTRQRRFLSVSSLTADHHNLSDFGDGDSVAISNEGLKMLLKGMTYPELEKWVQSHGYRPGQAMMLWKRMYGNNIWAHHIDELEGLNKDFKKMLNENAEFKALTQKEIRTASDGTRKILFTLEDGLVIETVVIPCDRGRTTVCVSSQVGCAMNCQFCYTGRQAFSVANLNLLLMQPPTAGQNAVVVEISCSAVQTSPTSIFGIQYFRPQFPLMVEEVPLPFSKMGLRRHLTAAEIVEQAVFARRLLTDEVGSITNVVFMGMGEPLHNIDNVIKAADIMVDEQGLQFSPRKVTISTSGLVPQLKRFLHESNCALAVSLNATTDEVRNWIMPINRKYKLELLLQTLREELCFKKNYKVLFEYVMLEGVNDRSFSSHCPHQALSLVTLDALNQSVMHIDGDAERLIELVKGIPCKINLISFNPHSGSFFKPTKDERMIEFRNTLAGAGLVVILRLSRGDDQMAACGQLGKPGTIQAPLLRVPEQFQMAIGSSA
ncbi:Dual-specificity RNA methyltransferase RlmN [Glycine max]|nr:Dual-specificity RNA methyltransferase RlmN [Glycine max]